MENDIKSYRYIGRNITYEQYEAKRKSEEAYKAYEKSNQKQQDTNMIYAPNLIPNDEKVFFNQVSNILHKFICSREQEKLKIYKSGYRYNEHVSKLTSEASSKIPQLEYEVSVLEYFCENIPETIVCTGNEYYIKKAISRYYGDIPFSQVSDVSFVYQLEKSNLILVVLYIDRHRFECSNSFKKHSEDSIKVLLERKQIELQEISNTMFKTKNS